MTIKELYEWAKNNNAEDMPIGLQYQDGGGSYYGDTWSDLQWDVVAKIEEAFGSPYVLLN